MTSSTSTVLGAAATPLALRFCGGPRDGQVVRLASRKCTIGAAENCTLRLRAPTIRPVHCLILRGPSETVVRRWSGDTLLNGHAFTDAILTPGDRLRCGPVELEWLEETQDSGEITRAMTQVIDRSPRAANTEVFAGNGAIEEQRKALEAEKQRWHDERRREEHQLDEQRRQVELLLAKQLARRKAADTAPPAGPGQESALASAANPNATQVMTQPFTPRPTADSARVVELEAELERVRVEVEQIQQELAAKQVSFEQEVASWKATVAQEQSQLATHAEEVRRHADQLQQAQAALDADTARIQAAQADLAERDEKWAAEQKVAEEMWNRRLDELDQRAAALAKLEAEIAARASQLQEAESQLAQSQADLSQAAQLQAAQLQAAQLQAAQLQAARPPEAAATVSGDSRDDDQDESEDAAPHAAPRVAGNENEDQSIEQYMSALLSRVGGHSARNGPSAAASVPAAPVVQPASSSPDPSSGPSVPTPPAVERAPRKAAPENTDTLAAMRDLANLNTRVALDRHGKARMIASAWMKATVAIAAFATSVWLVHGASGPTILGKYGVPATFVVGVVYSWLFAQTMRRRSHSKKSIQKLLAKTASTLTADEE
jgi:hypothetical protein